MKIIIAKGINKKLILPPNVILDLLLDVNLTIYKGQFVALTGISGSGKSTLMKILLGYDNESAEKIIINNKDIREMNERELESFRIENFGICYADKAPILLNLTVKENIIRRLQSLKKENIEEKANEIINIFKLSAVANQKVNLETIFELYRLMLAVAFSGSPPIIFIDEILDYFTVYERTELFENILTLQKKHHITLLIITSEIEIIKKADRVINIMNNTTYEVDMEHLRSITEFKTIE